VEWIKGWRMGRKIIDNYSKSTLDREAASIMPPDMPAR